MEQTPFDYATQSDTQKTSPRKRRPIFQIIVLMILICALGVGGYYGWQAREENLRREAILAQMREIVLLDNALVMEALEMDESSRITYAEYFKRTEKNKEERDTLVRKIRAMEAAPFTSQADNFVKLMELENEFIRAEEDVMRQNMKLSSMSETLKSVTTSQTKAQEELAKANSEYLAAPYGEDYDEKLMVDWAKAKERQTLSEATENYESYKEARTEMQQKMGAASLAIKDWIRQEPLLYSPLFPRRSINSYLVKRNTKYKIASKDGDAANNDTQVNAKSKSASNIVETAATTEPSVPTRLRSTSAFEGERFSETRIREMTYEEVSQMGDEDLRYAINEMFARYGMTFKDKTYQANFEGNKWYSPNDKWTANQIEKAFGSTERTNFKLLTAERSARQSAESEMGSQ